MEECFGGLAPIVWTECECMRLGIGFMVSSRSVVGNKSGIQMNCPAGFDVQRRGLFSVANFEIAAFDAADFTLVFHNFEMFGREWPRSLSGQRVGGGLLKYAADLAGVAIAGIGTLHHEDVSDSPHRINPCLRAPRAAVAKSAG